MTILPGLVVGIVVLLFTLAIARRFLSSLGVPTAWVSAPRISRACGRLVGKGIAGTWRVGRGTARYFQNRRRIRRRLGRASIGSMR
jgi:hypothetical protein